jgi:rare lipoprotein A
MRQLVAALLLCLLDIPLHAEDCVASVYAVGDPSQRGTKTASGIPLNDRAMSAAHKSLPFGSKVEVTNKKNGQAVTVTITDRGPYVKGRCIDLSQAGARALGFAGLAPVSVVPVVSERRYVTAAGADEAAICEHLPLIEKKKPHSTAGLRTKGNPNTQYTSR